MKKRSLVAAAIIGFMFLLVLGIKADAAEIKVLSAFGMQSVMEDLGPKFENATGHKLTISFATGGATVKRVQDGAAADVVITLRQGIDTLRRQGGFGQRDRTRPLRYRRGRPHGRTQARHLVARRLETRAARSEDDLLR